MTDDERSNGGGGGGGGRMLPEEGFRCPRCDSPNTKFCYYNNYSLTQPRHYCKACRRYWTRGGALRNVPVGGGCRKSKKSKSSSSAMTGVSATSSYSAPSSRFLLPLDICKDPLSSYCSVVDTATNPYKFFHGFSPDFHNLAAGILPTPLPIPSPPPPSAVATANSLMVDVNYPNGTYSESTMMIPTDQDLQWKLQQQRLSMFYGGGSGSGTTLSDLQISSSLSLQNNTDQRHQAQHFNNMEESFQLQTGGGNSSSWYQHQPSGISRNTSGNCTDVIMLNTHSSSNNNNNNNDNDNTWNDHIHNHHFSALP